MHREDCSFGFIILTIIIIEADLVSVVASPYFSSSSFLLRMIIMVWIVGISVMTALVLAVE